MITAKRFVRSLIKIILIGLVVLIAIAFVMLKWMERSPAQLKVGLESYLTQMAGYPADIGALNKISFVPSMMVEMENVRLWALDDPNRTMASAERVHLSMPFWSVMLGSARFSALSAEGIFVDEEVSGIAPIAVDKLYIDATTSALMVQGKVGDVSVTGEAPLEKKGRSFVPKSPPSRIAFEVSGPKTQGTIFADINKSEYGVTADFPRYASLEMRPSQMLLERLLDGRGTSGVLPVHLNIGRLENVAGPFDIPALTFENSALQPLECFYNNRSRAAQKPHPCAEYFQEPDTDETP